jgi:dethiobiotin synthetase
MLETVLRPAILITAPASGQDADLILVEGVMGLFSPMAKQVAA